MKALLTVLACALSTTVAAQQAPSSPFSVAGVRLGMPATAVPESLRKDCEPLKSRPTVVFCLFLTEASGVPLSVELLLADGRVDAIYVHFPRSEHDVVWLALRERYGKEHERNSKKIEWFSGPRSIDDLTPDEMSLTKIPDSPPVPDGVYIKEGTEYATIEYASMEKVREQARQREQDRRKKLKGLADKL